MLAVVLRGRLSTQLAVDQTRPRYSSGPAIPRSRASCFVFERQLLACRFLRSALDRLRPSFFFMRSSSSCMFSSKTSSSKSGGTICFFASPVARACLGRALRLLFQFHAFEMQQIFRALDRIFQRAVRVVEQRALLQAPFLLVAAGARVQIGMQFAAQFVKVFFQRRDVEVQLWRQAEEREIIRLEPEAALFRTIRRSARRAWIRTTSRSASPRAVAWRRSRLERIWWSLPIRFHKRRPEPASSRRLSGGAGSAGGSPAPTRASGGERSPAAA